ncbi:trigger factor [Rhodoflexus sp.]
MEITLEKNDSLTASIKITINEADYQDRIEKKIKEYARTAQIKGFRPGKVPVGIIRKMYGKSIKVSEVSAASTDALEKYLLENNIQIMGGPMMSDATQNGNYDWDTQTEFEFSYEIGLKPEIVPTLSKSIVIEKPTAEISEESLDALILLLRDMHASYEEQPTITDQPGVTIYGYIITANGQPIQVPSYDNAEELRDMFTPDSRGYGIFTIDQLGEHKSFFLDKKKGDSVTFDLRTLFPTDAQVSELLGISEKFVKNISGEFIMTITNIAIKQLPEMNQAFFNAIFGPGKVQDEAALRQRMRQIKEREALIMQKDQMLNQFQMQLLQTHNFDLPDAFMKRWLSANNPRLTQEQIERSYESYRDTMRLEILISELAKAKNIKVDMQDVVQYLSDINFMQIVRMGYFNMIGIEQTLAMRMLQDQENSQKVDDYVRLSLLHKVFDACIDEITVK